ncbi:hypothetical protein ACLMAJ_20025 [Nocardia sp. KC 131]|uniref:hypothetical protein n=1 Tax=Nocardia arseniciresistens TaxID=3392119 RepID=UPI00398F6573
MRTMSSLMGLRRRAATTPVTPAAATPTPISDSDVDPPIVAALVQPLLSLRASLGTGVAVPDRAITSALAAASTQAADTEAPQREGLHALESSWESTGADAAVPALRTTQTQIGEISDRGPAYLSVLGDAHATSSRAAQRVDQIIEDFRKDARVIMGNASSAPDTDAVIARATQALRDAVTTVTAAQTDMDGHTRRLDEMGPLTVTTPSGVSAGQGQYVPGATTPGQFVPGSTTGVAGTAGQPLDPAAAAQLQLQQALISAGVQLGTSAITAGVDIGTHLIDKIVEVGTHAMDTVAASVDKAIPELIHPGSTTGGGASGGTSTTPGGSSLFDFGAGAPKPTPGTGGAPAQNGSAASAKPDTKPAPAPAPPAQSDWPNAAADSPLPKPPAPSGQPGVTGGMALPPPPGSGGQEHKPRDGQLGVTVPTGAVAVPAAVIGDFDDFGDDTL